MRVVNLDGLKFGRLTVIRQVESDKWGKSRWLCCCSCGNEIIVNANNLKAKTNSCGCLKKELLHESKIIHGDYKKRLYHIWCLMLARCSNQNRPEYIHYGGRGIKVCKEWINDYSVFRQWALSNGYADNLSIDRIDVNGNYCPDNCRWATAKMQANNQRTNRFLSFNGQTLTLSEWADKTKINQDAIYGRLKRGWTIEQSLTIPLNGGRRNA